MAKVKPMNYNLALAINMMANPAGAGMSAKKISVALDMSYPTVRKYIALSQKEILALKEVFE